MMEGQGKTSSLPIRVGIFSPRWCFVTAVLLLSIGLGIFAYVKQCEKGLILTGMRTLGEGGAGWGLYIVFDIYFVGVSFAGITTAALVRLFNIRELKPLSRMAELLTIISLLLAIPCIFADLGQPLKALNYFPKYARPVSPFFGTFTLVVAGYLSVSLAYLWIEGRADAAYCAARARALKWFYKIWASGFLGTSWERLRHQRVTFWLSLTILPLLVTAHSTLGFVFGIQGGRPGWYSALQAPGFVIMAGVSGLGLLIIIAASIRRFLGLEKIISPGAFRILSNFLWVLILIYLYFMMIDELTAHYSATEMERYVAHEVVSGNYSWVFLTAVLCLVVPFLLLFLQFATGKYRIWLAVVSGILANFAAILKRFLIVVPSQTHGLLLSYRKGDYFPTWVEICIILGLLSLGALFYSIFLKVFPIVPVEPGAIIRRGLFTPGLLRARKLRLLFFWGAFVAGILLAILGFLFSARLWTKAYADPVLSYAPLLFILGIVLTFYSAAIYEVVPSAWLRRKRKKPASTEGSLPV